MREARQEVEREPDQHVARRGDITLSYRALGHGTTSVVLLGGLGSRGSDWGDVPRALAERYRVLVIDNRGSGRSSVTPPGFTIEDMAADVVAVLDAAGVARAHVLGHSMGGMIAQALALGHPERVLEVVLLNTHFGGQEVHSPSARAGPVVRPRSSHGSAGLAQRTRDNFALVTAPGFAATHPEVTDTFVQGVLAQPTSAVGFIGEIQATMLFDYATRVQSIATPVLVVQSRQDEVSPPPNGELLAARIPGARLVHLDDSGHFAMWDRPAELVAIVSRFFDGRP